MLFSKFKKFIEELCALVGGIGTTPIPKGAHWAFGFLAFVCLFICLLPPFKAWDQL